MKLWNFITRSLRYYWATNVAVAAGVAVAVAVLVGSLVVGDSVKGSLRRLALERLGRAELSLERDSGFRPELAETLGGLHASAILLDGSSKNPNGGAVVPHTQVVGIGDDFCTLYDAPLLVLGPREAAVNRRLARDLGINEGDDLLVSVGLRGTAPMESVFGRKGREDTLKTERVKVTAIIPDSGMGSFTLRADRPQPRTVFLSLAWIGRELGWADRVNTVLFAARTPAESLSLAEFQRKLPGVLTLTDEDLVMLKGPGDNLTLTSSRLSLTPAVLKSVGKLAADTGISYDFRSVYLANRLRRYVDQTESHGDLPYSLLGGVGELKSFESDTDEPLPQGLTDDEIVLNRWSADDLSASRGDRIEATFYTAGPLGDITTIRRQFKVAGVVKMSGAALDNEFVPVVKGMTDSRSMADWKPPFPIDLKRIRPVDEDYWNRYHTIPKAFVSLGTMKSLWTHGVSADLAGLTPWATAVKLSLRRVDGTTLTADDFAKLLASRITPEDAGFALRALRADALAAATASTDFGVLFLSLSSFLVASAAMLIFLLLRLTIDRRASQIGVLLAEGFTRRAASRVLVREALFVAILGLVIGVPLGIAYAQGIISALRSSWSGAVAQFPLALYVTALSLAIGAVSGLVVSAGAILLSARILRRMTPLTLLSGWQAIAAADRSRGSVALVIAVASLLGAAALLAASAIAKSLPAAAAFMLSGALLLVGLLSLLSALLHTRERGITKPPKLSVLRLAVRAAARHRIRSLLTAGLLASATFLIVTVATFRQGPSGEHPGPKDSATGGFNLLARSDVPIYVDLDSPDGRRKIGIAGAPADTLAAAQAKFYPFRESRGDDVSCLNLQRSNRPRILGVPPAIVERGGFLFGPHHPVEADAHDHIWKLLDSTLPDGAIPAFADADTAQWQLHLGLGDNITVPVAAGRFVTLRLVGLMPGSIFAGELLVSEANFVRTFGADTGYRFFLISCDTPREGDVSAALRESLGELGLDVSTTGEVLERYASVQNTYLSAFQTLGGLGLVLATFGIVTVLLRSVIERRSELSMMLALGFTPGDVRRIVLIENAALLVVGLFIGTFSALVAAGHQLATSVAGFSAMPVVWTLAATLLLGLASCVVAARYSLRGRLIDSLRSE